MCKFKTFFCFIFLVAAFFAGAKADVYEECKQITDDCDKRVACQLAYTIMDATSGKSVDYDIAVADAIMDIPACENYANSFTHDISISLSDDLQIKIDWNNVYNLTTPMQTVLLFTPPNQKNLTPGDIITENDIPKQFFNEQCSPYRNIAKNKNNSTPVNIAGRKLFLDMVSDGTLKNTDTQFVITNADGGANVFTGLIDASLFRGVLSYRPGLRNDVNDIRDKLPVVFSDYHDAYTKMTALAEELKGSACSGLLLFVASPIDTILSTDHTQPVIKQTSLLIRSAPITILR